MRIGTEVSILHWPYALSHLKTIPARIGKAILPAIAATGANNSEHQ